ncbi:C2 domain-containing protein [Melia azedarach]|uniref:C2 domain-containing protein n=1 Tax=Melia azedarach TaxID=155640 RepID=A0ACC1XJW9_MELAZ|nr:C2 domain-containing protein [Melia azedarach]
MPPEQKEDFSLKETSPPIGGGRVSGREKLTSSFDLVEQMQFLYVRIVRARDLQVNEVTGTYDPYVEVKIGNYKGTTISFPKKPNPEWNQVFAFTKERIQATSVEILVKDKMIANGDFIGKIKIDMPDIPKRVPPDSPLAPQWNRMEAKNGSRARGELMLALWWGTQADEAFSDAWHTDAAAVSGESIMNCRSKVYVSPKLWYVRVNLIEAQDLVPKQRNRNPEVYVKAVFGNMVLRTRVSVNKTENPTWNEDLMFVAAEPFDDLLVLTVEDKIGANKEECLGKLVLPLSKADRRFLPPPPTARWYNLERNLADGEEKKDVKFASRVCLRFSLEGGYHVFDESTYYSSDLRSTMKQLWPPAIGVLELGILNANGLLPMKSRDGKGTTDAYCVAKYANKWVRTRTVVDSFDPKWNEQYTWEVYDPYTVITLVVFDNCHLHPGGGNDSRIGKVRIRLSTLETDRIYTHSYPLIALQPNGVKKMGEIQLAVRFTCSSFANLLQTYSQPLLPKMHYINPLSVYQIESLRHQATNLLSSRLSRAEPPLRKEVVEYLLDVGSQTWSLRRGKANLARLMRFLNGFLAAWIWFDKVCRWKNPRTTFLVFVLYLTMIVFPQMILPTFFLFLFCVVIWKFRNRPRNPPHMDIKLSYADRSHPDELDEEFDTFPSSKQGHILTTRYDRLRSIAARMIAINGDLDTQLERLQSLITWRDPRATAMFAIFCLVSAVVFYSFPFRVLLLLAGCFALRPPKLRIDIPPSPQNFLRRLPSQTESLL